MGQGIYFIICNVNAKIYVGSTKNFKKRRGEHRRELNRDKHHSQHLQNAWNKYGKENFFFVLIEKVDNEEDLFMRESEWIKKQDTLNRDKGYNLAVPLKLKGLKYNDEIIENKRHLGWLSANTNGTIEEYKEWRSLKFDFPRYFPKPTQEKRVFVFDSETGEHIRTYRSVSEASKNFNNSNQILKRGELKYKSFSTTSGYILITEDRYDKNIQYKNEVFVREDKYIKKGAPTKEITVYDKVTNKELGTFQNHQKCAEFLNGSKKGIDKFLSGERSSYKGCTFKHTGNITRTFN